MEKALELPGGHDVGPEVTEWEIGTRVVGLMALRMAVLGGTEIVFAVDPLANRRKWATRKKAPITYSIQRTGT